MTSPRHLLSSLFVCATVLAGPGCNMHKMTADMTAGPVRTGSIVMDREADLEFAAQAIPASLKTVESFLVSSPDNPDLLYVLARGYSAYAFGMIERELEKVQITGTEEQVESLTQRAVMHYLRGREYGFRLLAMPALEKAARAGDLPAVDRELRNVTKEQAPALFWTTYGWGGAANLGQEDPELVAALPVLERMIGRVIELDADFEHGLPLLFLAVYYSSKPAMAGGDPGKAKELFERAMKAHGQANLLVPYLYARFYAPAVQDRALFEEMMNKVLAGNVLANPDLRLVNEIARDLARFWLANADELILE